MSITKRRLHHLINRDLMRGNLELTDEEIDEWRQEEFLKEYEIGIVDDESDDWWDYDKAMEREKRMQESVLPF